MTIKVKDIGIAQGDLGAMMDVGPRETPGATVQQRRAKGKRPISSTDRRRRPQGEARTEQYNVRVTPNLAHAVEDARVALDLTKAELTERALRYYIAAIRRGEKDAGVDANIYEAA